MLSSLGILVGLHQCWSNLPKLCDETRPRTQRARDAMGVKTQRYWQLPKEGASHVKPMLPSANWADVGALETGTSLPQLLGWERREPRPCSCGLRCFSSPRGSGFTALGISCLAIGAGPSGTKPDPNVIPLGRRPPALPGLCSFGATGRVRQSLKSSQNGQGRAC